MGTRINISSGIESKLGKNTEVNIDSKIGTKYKVGDWVHIRNQV